MHADAPFISMPLSNAAWSLVRRQRGLALAFALSMAFHLFAWLATPYFNQAWHQPLVARFDAVLVPSVESRTASDPALKGNSNRTRRIARPGAHGPAPAPKPEASFAAPEDTIAVDPMREPDNANGEIVATVTDEKTPIAPENNPSTIAPRSIADAMPPTIPVAVDKAEPDPPPAKLPSRISIAYKMTSSISDGVAYYTWTRDGDRFDIDSTMQATGFIVGNFVGVLHQVSRGVVTATGLQPSSYQIRRGDGAPETADFLRASNELKLTRAGEARLLPLPPLIQDMQSFLFQLAFDAPGMQRPDDRLEVLVTNARKVYRHHFRLVGIETIQARSGSVPSIHLRSDASDPEDTYEVWLDPDKYYLPAKIKFFAGRFPVELIATSIRTTP